MSELFVHVLVPVLVLMQCIAEIYQRLWKEEHIRQKLVDITEREHANVGEGDQSILNMVFEDRYLNLPDTL